MVSIHRPEGYGPPTLPLRHSAYNVHCTPADTVNDDSLENCSESMNIYFIS